MKVQIDRTETGIRIRAKETNRHAHIASAITCCRPDGYRLTLYESLPEVEVPRGYCHITAFRLEADTLARLEAAASRWVTAGVIVPACQAQPLE